MFSGICETIAVAALAEMSRPAWIQPGPLPPTDQRGRNGNFGCRKAGHDGTSTGAIAGAGRSYSGICQHARPLQCMIGKSLQ